MQEQTGQEYSCKDCDDQCPDLMDENEDVFEIWATCNTQWRVSAFSVVGIDLPAVFEVAGAFGVSVTRQFINKIKALELYELNRLRAKGGDKDG